MAKFIRADDKESLCIFFQANSGQFMFEGGNWGPVDEPESAGSILAGCGISG